MQLSFEYFAPFCYLMQNITLRGTVLCFKREILSSIKMFWLQTIRRFLQTMLCFSSYIWLSKKLKKHSILVLDCIFKQFAVTFHSMKLIKHNTKRYIVFSKCFTKCQMSNKLCVWKFIFHRYVENDLNVNHTQWIVFLKNFFVYEEIFVWNKLHRLKGFNLFFSCRSVLTAVVHI